MEEAMRVIITGGTGLIGRALSETLATDGHEVVVLTRSPDKTKGMPKGVQLQKWDGATPAGWGHLVDGAGAIVNLAGAGIADSRWSKERKQAIRQSRVAAGNAVTEAIKGAANKPQVLIQSSAVGYYGGATGNELVTEAHSPGGDFLAKVCFDWEISTAGVSRLGVRRAVVRTGIVLSMAGGAFPKQLLPFKLYAGGPVGSGKQWMPWIHIDDEVRAIQFLIANPQAEGPFNLVAPNPVTNKEFGKLIGEVMGRPSFMPAPDFALKTVFGEMSTILLEGQRVVPKKLLDLGFEFRYPTARAALVALLRPGSVGQGGANRTEASDRTDQAGTPAAAPEKEAVQK
jgi:hypothetical protein